MKKETVIAWLDCNKKLPYNGEKILLIYSGEIKTAIFEKGLSINDREKMKKGKLPDPVEWGWCLSDGHMPHKRSTTIKRSDEHGNNLVPYCWVIDGHTVFGQDIKYWAHFPNINEKGDKNNE